MPSQPLTLWPVLLTMSGTLIVSAVIALATQIIMQYAVRKTQDIRNEQNNLDHVRIEQQMNKETMRQDENLQAAIGDQKESYTRLEDLLGSVVVEHKETNKLLLQLIGTVTDVASSNKNLASQIQQQGQRIDFHEARFRDLETKSAENSALIRSKLSPPRRK